MASMRKIAVIGALGVGALGLVGVGAGASFTDSVSAAQKVTAGTMNMTVAPTDLSQGTASADGKSVTFNDLGPVGSTFDSTAEHVTIANKGNINVNAWRVSMKHTLGSAASSAALAGELYVKVTSNDPSKGPQTLFDGKLTDLEANPIPVTGPLAPNATDDLAVEFYAGSGNAPSLDNSAEGGEVTPTVTVDYVG